MRPDGEQESSQPSLPRTMFDPGSMKPPRRPATKLVLMYDNRMKGKQRLSASVDSELVEAGHIAVAEGRAETLSAWVNEALRLKADHDRRMRALDEFLMAYEAEHGEISDDEMTEAARRARARATVVRGTPTTDQPRRGNRRGAA